MQLSSRLWGRQQKKAINKTYDNVESVPLIQNDPIHFMNMSLMLFLLWSAKMFRNAKGL